MIKNAGLHIHAGTGGNGLKQVSVSGATIHIAGSVGKKNISLSAQKTAVMLTISFL